MKIVSKEIEIVTVFDTSGKIKPIRFRYENDEGYVVIKVDKILDVKESRLAGEQLIIYACQSLINNTVKLFEIKYEKRTCKWFLYKI